MGKTYTPPLIPHSRVKECENCIYRGTIGGDWCCDYWEIADQLRPCPPGKDCTVRVIGKFKKTTIFQKYARMESVDREGIERDRRLRARVTNPRTARWDIERGFRLYCQGFTYEQIAVRVGASKSAVAWIARSHDWKALRRKVRGGEDHDDEAMAAAGKNAPSKNSWKD